MAGLAEILNDPNYVNANAATKAAIFDKFSASDTNFTGANPETQSAIRTRFGLSPVSQPRAASSEIPAERRATEPGLTTLLNPLAGAYGLAEAGTNLVTGLGASAVGGLRGLYSLATGDTAAEATRKVQATQEALTYTPRSAPGAAATRLIALPMELAAQGVGAVGGKIGKLTGNEALGQTIGENIPAVAATIAGGPGALRAGRNVGQTMAAERAATQLEQSRLNAAAIETARKAVDMELVLNPAISNPTKANRAKGMLIGNADVNTSNSQKNVAKVTEIAKNELGLPQGTKLTQAAYDTAREQISPPYNAIRAIPALTDDTGAIVQQLQSLQRDPLIGGKGADKKITALIDEAIDTVNAGGSGKRILDNIEQLRQDANNIYGSLERPDRIQRSVADASKGIANALEGLIDQHLTRTGDTTLLRDFQAARPRMAQTYAYEKATDFNTGTVDALALARITSRDNAFTGRLADLGQIAGTFPEAFASGAPASFARRHLTRSGPAGTAGFAVGLLAGQPFAGGIIGAGLGELGGLVGAKRIASRKYQEANAVPLDYRPLREAMGYNNLAAAVQPPPVNTLPVPFVSQGPIITTAEAPNWVYGRPDIAPPAVTVGLPEYQGPRQLAAPSSEATMANLAQQRASQLANARSADVQAARAAEAESAAARLPTGRGSAFDLDPITGRLRNVSQGMKGATPDVIASTGFPLSAAVEKVSSGRNFALSAEELIAWNKAKVDIATIEPGFNKLSEKAIFSKMQDRAWVADAIQKAQDQAKGFAEIARRSPDPIAAAKAEANRARIMDVAESLGETLRARPVAKSSQGPKTRAAQRLNQLAPEESQNRLAAP